MSRHRRAAHVVELQERKVRRRWRISPLAPLLAVLLSASCADRESGPAVLTADLPLHLEDHLEAATIEGSEVPKDIPEAVEWRFDEPQPDWRRIHPWEFHTEPAELVRTGDALRLVFADKNRDSDGDFVGGLYVGLPDWRLEEWAYVAVEARV